MNKLSYLVRKVTFQKASSHDHTTATRPDLIFDEPTQKVDENRQKDFYALFKDPKLFAEAYGHDDNPLLT